MVSSKVVPFILALLLLSTFAAAQLTTVPLDTGYNYAAYGPYPTSGPPTPDHYWINIASYPVTASAIAPAWVLQSPGPPWLLPLSSTVPLSASNWIGASPVVGSAPGTNPSNPAYTIFRKCFCLMPNYTNPQITFTAMADDDIQMWLNSQLNVLLPPTVGNFGGPALSSLPSNPAWFHVGLNCIYALVEDTAGGWMGFDLTGTIQAVGLAPQPAFGVDQTFTCPCNRGASGNLSESNESVDNDDSKVVAALVQIAEERRLSRTRLVSIPQHR